jgi:hypothetical protein
MLSMNLMKKTNWKIDVQAASAMVSRVDLIGGVC